MNNPHRPGPLRVFASEAKAESITSLIGRRQDVRLTVIAPPDLARMLPAGAVHQGVALHGPVPEGLNLEDLTGPGDGVIVMLDQVTDPQNIGAIFRSAAAFGARGIVLQDRHSPPVQGVLVKTAAGAADRVPFVRVTNLSRALEALSEDGFRSIGLAGEATECLHELSDGHTGARRWVVVLGSEGDGLRRLVAEHCDHLARIPMPGGFESLNVSHAASLALYELLGRRTKA